MAPGVHVTKLTFKCSTRLGGHARFTLRSPLISYPWIAIALALIWPIFRFAHRSIALKKTSGSLSPGSFSRHRSGDVLGPSSSALSLTKEQNATGLSLGRTPFKSPFQYSFSFLLSLCENLSEIWHKEIPCTS